MARTKKEAKSETKKETTNQPAKKRAHTKGKAKDNVAALALAKADPTEGSLGIKVWWDLWKVDGLRTDLEKAFTQFGAEDCVPPMLTPVARMTYAMERMRSTCKVDFKKAGRANGWATFAAVQTQKSRNEAAKKDEHKASVDTQVVSSIAVEEKTGEVSLQKPNCTIAKTVVAEYKRLNKHFTSWELSNAVVAVVESLHGARLRLAGGLYYVPHPKEASERTDWQDESGRVINISKKIVALAAYVKTIGDCDFYIEEVTAHSATARAAQNTTMHGLDKEFNEIIEQAKGFVDAVDLREAVSTRSLNAKIKALKSIRGRAELFSEILADRGERLVASADVLTGALKELVDGVAQVRALERVEGSEAAQHVANTMAAELAAKTQASLARAMDPDVPEATTADTEAQAS